MMLRLLLPWLLVFASLAAMAAVPRFLGPPVKKPADAGAGGESTDPGAADAGFEDAGQADAPILNVGDDAPMFAGVLHDPKAAGVPRVDLSSMVGGEADADQAAKAALPSVFIVNKEGKVAMVKQGYPDDAAGFLRAEVEEALQ